MAGKATTVTLQWKLIVKADMTKIMVCSDSTSYLPHNTFQILPFSIHDPLVVEYHITFIIHHSFTLSI